MSRFRLASNRAAALVLLLSLLATAQAATASDGVIEISHAGAVAGGVTLGDGPGYPVTISERGSYVLTSDLTVPSATHGLVLTTSGVSIDLNGFTIRGPGTCSSAGSTLMCTETAGTHGINGGGRTGINVRNGTIRGFGAFGVYVADDCRLKDVSVIENNSTGILAGDACVIESVVARRNGGDGIACDTGCGVFDATSFANRGDGVDAKNASVIRSVSAFDNGLNGFNISFGGVVRDSSAYLNEANGYAIRGGTLVESSTAYANALNQLDSINSDCSYHGNNFTLSSGSGLINGCFNAGENTCGIAACP
jgi:hypothetical protein